MPKKPPTIEASLRAAILKSNLTLYALAKAAIVTPSQIDRFMLSVDDPRHRGISLATAARLAEVLGLELLARTSD